MTAAADSNVSLLLVAVLPACLALSFLLSGMEAGVFALSRLRIRQLMREGKSSAKILHRYLEGPENFLWTILAGNTVANFVILSVIVAELYQRIGPRPGWFIALFAATVFLFYTLCDLLPKMLFRTFPNRLCLFCVQPFRFIHLALAPLVSVMEKGSKFLLRWTGGKVFTGRLFGNRIELRMVMQEASQGLTSDERLMINRVLDLHNLTVGTFAVPLNKALTLGLDATVDEVFENFRRHRISRLPVWDKPGRPDAGIVGVIILKDLLYSQDAAPGSAIAPWVKPALFLDGDMRLELALRRMQKSGQRLAVVRGRDQKPVGIVTLQDILKVIFVELSL